VRVWTLVIARRARKEGSATAHGGQKLIASGMSFVFFFFPSLHQKKQKKYASFTLVSDSVDTAHRCCIHIVVSFISRLYLIVITSIS
jgi:hypothetical protein